AYFIFTAVFDGVLINAFVTTLYILIFYKIYAHSRAVSSPGSKMPTQKFALRLATSGFLMFLCFLALGVFSILTAMEPADDRWMYRDIWFIANDILCSSNAPIILILNKPVRDFFWALLGGPDPGRPRRDSLTKKTLFKQAQMLVSYNAV
uniref:G-protein coupled receptors family 1 profile domain-containing protein n=1 Tax=Plectus sambesii TaxID=2011161 RepID=A0A914VFQ5_9BILA